MPNSLATEPGKSYPLGATVRDGGVNFALFSQHATAVELLLFDGPDAPLPSHVLRLDPESNRTFYYWHLFVPGLQSGRHYAYRVQGPFAPQEGHRYDGDKVLLDPYAKGITSNLYDRAAACRPGDNCARAMRSVVVDTSLYDWEGDTPLGKRRERSVIYEMHVGGFTKHLTSGVAPAKRGTFAGLIEKIPYLVDLGINTVELLPVQQFDPQDAPAGLTNYWGYSPIGFFAPHGAYGSRPDAVAVVDEFRDMVKALHRAGIAVLLDVVYNHTTENGADGPTLCFRGLENVGYYIPGSDPSTYANYSGCGNTLNANHSIVRRMIADSLRYWVTEMHVDGFRFDLASALSRGEFGEPLSSPPLLWAIESDPVLAGTEIVAEAWDAGGLYQVGSFIGDRFAEWNGRFRDDVRSFVKGDPSFAVYAGLRLMGSPDLYPRTDRNVRRTVNFITCHDGFTMNDLVSYNQKHNQANGENNRDGHNDNRSWNGGVEGPTTDPSINALREQQSKNHFAMLMLAEGTPMFLMGDEVRRTQRGNNNAYGHDNPLSWFDWRDVEKHTNLLRFVRTLIALQRRIQVLQLSHYLHLGTRTHEPFVLVHGTELGRPEFEPETRWLSLTYGHPEAGERLHLIFNAFWEPLEFEIPHAPRAQRWRRLLDTSLPTPKDVSLPADAPEYSAASYLAQPRSTVALLTWPPNPRRTREGAD